MAQKTKTDNPTARKATTDVATAVRRVTRALEPLEEQARYRALAAVVVLLDININLAPGRSQ